MISRGCWSSRTSRSAHRQAASHVLRSRTVWQRSTKLASWSHQIRSIRGSVPDADAVSLLRKGAGRGSRPAAALKSGARPSDSHFPLGTSSTPGAAMRPTKTWDQPSATWPPQGVRPVARSVMILRWRAARLQVADRRIRPASVAALHAWADALPQSQPVADSSSVALLPLQGALGRPSRASVPDPHATRDGNVIAAPARGPAGELGFPFAICRQQVTYWLRSWQITCAGETHQPTARETRSCTPTSPSLRPPCHGMPDDTRPVPSPSGGHGSACLVWRGRGTYWLRSVKICATKPITHHLRRRTRRL